MPRSKFPACVQFGSAPFETAKGAAASVVVVPDKNLKMGQPPFRLFLDFDSTSPGFPVFPSQFSSSLSGAANIIFLLLLIFFLTVYVWNFI
jgi:hypothetical protein